jgi:hypothetical protein
MVATARMLLEIKFWCHANFSWATRFVGDDEHFDNEGILQIEGLPEFSSQPCHTGHSFNGQKDAWLLTLLYLGWENSCNSKSICSVSSNFFLGDSWLTIRDGLPPGEFLCTWTYRLLLLSNSMLMVVVQKYQISFGCTCMCRCGSLWDQCRRSRSSAQHLGFLEGNIVSS